MRALHACVYCAQAHAARMRILRVGAYTACRRTVRRRLQMDTLGIEPRASRMLSGCDTTTPCAPGALNRAHFYSEAKLFSLVRAFSLCCFPCCPWCVFTLSLVWFPCCPSCVFPVGPSRTAGAVFAQSPRVRQQQMQQQQVAQQQHQRQQPQQQQSANGNGSGGGSRQNQALDSGVHPKALR